MEQYGRSPATEAIDSIKSWNRLPQKERTYAMARFIEERGIFEWIDSHTNQWIDRPI